jgi:hypothetical protein
MALLRSVAVLPFVGIRLSIVGTAGLILRHGIELTNGARILDGAGAPLFLERLAQAAGHATCETGRELT